MSVRAHQTSARACASTAKTRTRSRQRAAFKAPVSARTKERAAHMLGSAQSEQRAAAAGARVRRQRTCLVAVKVRCGWCDLRGPASIRGPRESPDRHPGPKFC